MPNKKDLPAEVLSLLLIKKSEGFEFVTYHEEAGLIGSSSLTFFKDEFDAMQYCYDQTTDLDSEAYMDLADAVDNIKFKIMNEMNEGYICNQVLYSGFGESKHEEIKAKMRENAGDFTVDVQQTYGSDLVDARLHFGKSKTQDFYFFNKFDLTVHSEERPGADLRNTFFNNKTYNYTAKEAYNMLAGERAVYKEKATKEGEKYSTWDVLNTTDRDQYGNYPITTYGDRYGFDLEKELNRLPLKVKGDDLEQLLDGIKRGNRMYTKMELGESTEGFYLIANPKKRTVEVYDQKGESVTNSRRYELERRQKESNVLKENNAKKENQNQGTRKRNGKKV